MTGFPDIRQPDESIFCGAYTTTAALHAFGLLPVRGTKQLNELESRKNTFTGKTVTLLPSDKLEAVCRQIYMITGILPTKYGLHTFEPKGINSLVAMSYVLSSFGLKVLIVFRDEQTKEDFRAKYPQEFALNESTRFPTSVDTGDTRINQDEVLICSVRTSNVGSHSIIMNPERKWYDPASGRNELLLGDICDWDSIPNAAEGRAWNGVAIRVSVHRKRSICSVLRSLFR